MSVSAVRSRGDSYIPYSQLVLLRLPNDRRSPAVAHDARGRLVQRMLGPDLDVSAAPNEVPSVLKLMHL